MTISTTSTPSNEVPSRLFCVSIRSPSSLQQRQMPPPAWSRRGDGALWTSFGLLCLTWILSGCLVVWRHAALVSTSDDTPRQGGSAAAAHVDWKSPSSTLLVEDACVPHAIHLSQASDVDFAHVTINMTVSFLLDYALCQDAEPQVIVPGSKQLVYRPSQQQQPLQFPYTYYRTPNETYQSDWIYHVHISDLQADRSYDYRIRVALPKRKGATIASAPSTSSWTGKVAPERALLRHEPDAASATTKSTSLTTPTFSFRTPPLPHSPTTVAIIGDLGQTTNSTLTMAHILRASQQVTGSTRTSTAAIHAAHPVSMWMIVGDVAYADSDPYRWESWFARMQPLLSTLPLHVAVGNHEIECDHASPHSMFNAYEHYFSNPNRVRDARRLPASHIVSNATGTCSCPSQFMATYDYGNSFYAYTHGLMRMIVLNSYTHSHVGSPQYEWLVSELEHYKHHPDGTPWLIVSFHAPFYNTFHAHENETESNSMKASFEPLFVQYGVNFVFSGHVHAYMRTHPIKYYQRDDLAPIYIIIGSGGNREGHNSNGFVHNRSEPWVAARDLVEFGYGRLHMANATHAHWSWVRDGTTAEGIHDQLWIRNQRM